ncbi:o-succinylbenzoate--CoA ligase [Radiobacillus sp. PE A8.2]|uniref:o-succinylbenzoate--CoA ligase n=1 Tax=Radiobacillus sp. PE A8.2 TaxID=3380349 RepID=UPI00388D8532
MSEVIPHWLNKQAELSPNKIAIELPNGTTLNFQQLKQASQSYAGKLITYGVKRGDHVGIYAQNSLAMVVAIHALSYVGAVVVLLNTRLSAAEIAYQLKDANVTVVLTQPSLMNAAEQSVAITTRNIVVCDFEKIGALSETNGRLQDELALDDLFTIIYTSGTTGAPKGVTHTYGNHFWSAIASALNLGLSDRDKWLLVLPLFHVGGLSIVMKSVVYGMTAYIMGKFDEKTVHHAIMNQGVTMLSVVSVMLVELLDELGDDNYPESFRCMLLGGGPAPKPLLETAKVSRVPVFQTYGMTETSSQIVTLSPSYALDKLGSAGKALLPAQIKIVGSDNKPAAANEVGEIIVKGPMVTNGYYENAQANERALHEGWLSTGDLGYVDEEGFLYIMDRRKDLIISGGENIYPAEIESVLVGLKGIKEAGVVGKVDKRWGQVPVAFIVKKEGHVDRESIIDYCANYLAKYKVPKQIYFVDELPRNAAKKLQRYQLVEWLKDSEQD